MATGGAPEAVSETRFFKVGEWTSNHELAKPYPREWIAGAVLLAPGAVDAFTASRTISESVCLRAPAALDHVSSSPLVTLTLTSLEALRASGRGLRPPPGALLRFISEPTGR